ncbi:DNA-protecting protein DprA, partial [Candidatus Falkowbacteria bacterium]|nr:DNA-protecting protein DprA [Candidatus Falkowbacteria bacterium]
INFVYLEEDSYPKLLKEIYDPPFLLYYQGEINFDNNKGLAIIGSRKHSAYGEKVVNYLLNYISGSELVIISGLAYGIDSLAHNEALKNNLATIAVLGTGLEENDIYPQKNLKLAREILTQGGALISEFPPGTKALKQNFPLRNRIISGLSQAILVIEAKEKSGSSITIKQALDQGREVMAIPGNIFSEFSGGTNKLIVDGAKLIRNGDDVLEFFISQNLIDDKANKYLNKKSLTKKRCVIKFENEEERLIYSLIKKANERMENIKLEEISEITKLDTAIINSTLSILEIKSLIKNGYNGYNLSEL